MCYIIKWNKKLRFYDYFLIKKIYCKSYDVVYKIVFEVKTFKVLIFPFFFISYIILYITNLLIFLNEHVK